MDGRRPVGRRRKAVGGVPLVPLPRASRSKKPVESPECPPLLPRASRSKKPVVSPGRPLVPRRGGARLPVGSPFPCKKPPPPDFAGYIASGLPKRKCMPLLLFTFAVTRFFI